MRRLKPLDVGYFRKGVPDVFEMQRLQKEYAARILASGNLSPEIMAKFSRLRKFSAEGSSSKWSKLEARTLAAELAPHFHFNANDVDWERAEETHGAPWWRRL